MPRDVTAHDAWTMRQHGMVPPDEAPRYEDPRVAQICRSINEASRELFRLDEELALLAKAPNNEEHGTQPHEVRTGMTLLLRSRSGQLHQMVVTKTERTGTLVYRVDGKGTVTTADLWPEDRPGGRTALRAKLAEETEPFYVIRAPRFVIPTTPDPLPGQSGCFRSEAIFLIEGATRDGGPGGWGVGGWTKNGAGRIVHGGPMVQGPHAYAYGRAAVIDTRGGTGRINAEAEAEGRLFRVKPGDVLEMVGDQYRLMLDRFGYPSFEPA